jgi:carbonic anhydrase
VCAHTVEGYLLRQNVSVPTSSNFTPNADELIANNEAYVAQFSDVGLPLNPKRHMTVVACMDSRMNIFEMLGLEHGEAHIIRNAGGVVTDDVIRSLVISQRYMATREIVLIHHTNCGLQTISEDEFKHEIEDECGFKPWWAVETFRDPFADVKQSIARIRHSPFVKYKDFIRGFVYDVETGALNEVTQDNA